MARYGPGLSWKIDPQLFYIAIVVDDLRHSAQPPRNDASAAPAEVPDLRLVADSVDADRAVARGRSRGARDKANALSKRVQAAQEEAQRAYELAVSVLAEADGLRRAMESRSEIDIAKGMLVERHGVHPQAAFEMLVALSQQHHVKLVEVARAMVKAALDQHE